MKCKDLDKLIHLYLDGEIDKDKLKEIEEHLTSCQRCAEKLSQLKNLEAAAKNIKLSEPSPAYWQTFTRKVSDEIILRRRKSIWAKIKSAWESTFIYSPAKLRIAGGIASVLLVFIIGKLYLDYRGGELERIRRERMEEALSTKVPEASKKFEPAMIESLQVEVLKELAPPTPVTPTPEEKVQEQKQKDTRGGKTQLPKSSVNITTEKPKIDKRTTANLRTIPTEVLTMPTEQPIQLEKANLEFHEVEGITYYKVDTLFIRTLSLNDSLVEVDTLKKVISAWGGFFEEKPESEWNYEGFSQIKIAYQLLFLKSKDESSLDEGIKLLNKYKESAVEQKTKDELNKNISELEALRKK